VILAKTLENFASRNGGGTFSRRTFSIIANGVLSFEDGLKLVSKSSSYAKKHVK
jgi:hypothetical protein